MLMSGRIYITFFPASSFTLRQIKSETLFYAVLKYCKTFIFIFHTSTSVALKTYFQQTS